MSPRVRLAAAALLAVSALATGAKYELTKNGTVISYDRRPLMIDGRREIFFSGSIHYPRSPPDRWPDLIAKAKDGGLNVVETYVFWNVHEPEKDVVREPRAANIYCSNLLRDSLIAVFLSSSISSRSCINNCHA
jgi:hypothetical protein